MSSKINFAFFGTDEFAVGVLSELESADYLPSLIVTTPDQATGRRGVITPPPAKLWATERQIPVEQPDKLSRWEVAPLGSSELFVVASYGKIIPQTILDIPRYDVLNVHPSILPKYRGPSPLQSAILNGDPETGVTIMKMDAEMDHGPIVKLATLTLTGQNYAQLRDQLAAKGGQLLAEIIPDWISGKITPVPQDENAASYTQKFTKADAELKPEDDEIVKYRKVLALNPEPGAWMLDSGVRLKVKSAHLDGERFVPDLVVPEGRREMSWNDFQRGQS